MADDNDAVRMQQLLPQREDIEAVIGAGNVELVRTAMGIWETQFQRFRTSVGPLFWNPYYLVFLGCALVLIGRFHDGGAGTALHAAAKSGSSIVMHRALYHDLDVDVQNADGRTPLHVAVERGHVDIARRLLDFQPSQSFSLPDGRHLWELALERGDLRMYALLASRGLGAQNVMHGKIMHGLIDEAFLSLFKDPSISEKEAGDISHDVLLLACDDISLGSLNALPDHLFKHVDKHGFSLVDKAIAGYCPPIILAEVLHRARAVSLLGDERQQVGEFAPLHTAALTGSFLMAESIASATENLRPTSKGLEPLHIARALGNFDFVSFLTDIMSARGYPLIKRRPVEVDVDALKEKRRQLLTPLVLPPGPLQTLFQLIVWDDAKAFVEALEALQRTSTSPFEPIVEGTWSPLMVAIDCSRPLIVSQLLSYAKHHGIDAANDSVARSGGEDSTTSSDAAIEDSVDVADRSTALAKLLYTETSLPKMLREGPAQDEQIMGFPVHYAARLCSTAILELLIDASGDVHARNSLDETPLLVALRRGCLETANMLLQSKGAHAGDVDQRQWTAFHHLGAVPEHKLSGFLQRQRVGEDEGENRRRLPELAEMMLRLVEHDGQQAPTTAAIASGESNGMTIEKGGPARTVFLRRRQHSEKEDHLPEAQ